LSCLINVDNIKKIHRVVFELQAAPKAVIKGVLASNTVDMVTYCATEVTTTCATMIGQLFDAMTVASSDKEWL